MDEHRRGRTPLDLQAQLEVVLQDLLERDERISARAVLKALPELKAASSITRVPSRNELLLKYKASQEQRRSWVSRAKHKSTASLVRDLAARDAQVAEKDHQIQLLVASHRALIHAAGEVGAMAAYRKLFKGYEACLEELRRLGALTPTAPPGANSGPRRLRSVPALTPSKGED